MRDFYREEYGVSTWLFAIALFPLFFGGIGESGLYNSSVKEHFLKVIIGVVFMLPALTLFAVTYLRIPILTARRFRYCLLWILGWFASFAVLAELLWCLGYLPSDRRDIASTIFRIMMHTGWLSFIPLVFAYVTIRRHESSRNLA
jgi:hypothetical protein